MSNKEPDYRFFGEGFQASWPELGSMVHEVGELADELMAQYGVDEFDDLPPEVKEGFGGELAGRSWPLEDMNPEEPANE